MYMDYGDEVRAEIERRKTLGLLTLRWYKCHGCDAEYSMKDGMRPNTGCSNVACTRPSIHIHSDLDGEKPLTLKETS